MDYCFYFNCFGGLCSDKMIKLSDILFWIVIALIIGLALWLMLGSPTTEAGLVSLALFVAASEILLWKAIFKVDKNTSLGFLKVKKDLDMMQYKLINNINELKELLKRNKAVVE